jgi:hypothetical protein
VKWNEFIAKLTEAKAKGQSSGLDVHCITNLIFNQAFDSMIDHPPEGKEQLPVYTQMYEDVKKALKSQAKLPSPTKSDLIGLDEVTNEAHLALWRHQTNPLATFSLLDYNREGLFLRGFRSYNHPVYKWSKAGIKGKTIPYFAIDNWSAVFDKPDGELFRSFTGRYPKRGICLVGVVTDVKMRPYQNGTKERMVVSLFTGHEHVDDLIIWPERDGKVKEFYKGLIKPKSIGIAAVVPNLWNGRKSGYIQYWSELVWE